MQDRENALREAAERAQLFLDLNAELLTAVDFTTARHWLDDSPPWCTATIASP